MPDTGSGHEPLGLECRVFTGYLAGRMPDEYIRLRYERGHARIPYRLAGGLTSADRAILRVARLGTVPARMADIYCRFLRPTDAPRQKLVLLFAVLENSPETHSWFNTAAEGGPVTLIGGLVISGIASALLLAVGIVCLGPLHLLAGASGAGRAPA
jgi:hypothetical protein